MRRLPRAGGGDQRRGASRAGNSATVASPGPAPKTIIAPSSGWLAIRPRWIVHRCYSGPWRPRRGRHPLRSRSPARAFRDVAPGPGGCGGARVRRPLPVLRRRHQEAFRRLVDHRHLPFAKRFIAMLHASGAHRRCNVGAFRTPVPLADARRCRPTRSRHSRSCWPYPCREMIYDGS
jgi:hypothetical protein